MSNLNEYWYIYFIVGLAIILVVVIALIIVAHYRHKKEKRQVMDESDYQMAWVEALGGEPNIKSVLIVSDTKLEVTLNDMVKYDKPLLSELGVKGTVLKSHKLTITLDSGAPDIERLLSTHIKG